MPEFKIFTEWKRHGTIVRETTGLVLGADTAERALEMATRRGTASGLGFNPSYVGLAAIEITCTCTTGCEMHPPRAYRYENARNALASILMDLSALAGDTMPEEPGAWQDLAGTCAVNLRYLASQLEQARLGRVINGPVVFPSPSDCGEE